VALGVMSEYFFCGGRSDTGTGVSLSTPIFPSVSFHPCYTVYLNNILKI
jgi:hypothetical protein